MTSDVAPKKKPGLALVIGMGKSKAGNDDEADGPSEDDGDYDAAIGELADSLGVSDDKVDAFSSAFKAAVMSCK